MLSLALMTTLNTSTLPPIGYGTWPYKGEECTKAVEEALDMGYTILDTATFYNNFEAIEKAIRSKNREELTIISKVWPTNQSPADLKKDLKDSLQRLNTPYIDIYLLHWPNSSIPIRETLQAMEEARKAGMIREIGVSNFTVNHLKKILELEIPISWNQIEISPQFYDPELLAFCHEHKIGVQAYSPIGRGNLINDPVLTRLASKYGKVPAQIALRWVLQHHALPIPGTRNPQHMAENLAVYDFELTQDEMEEINAQAKNGKRNRVTIEKKLDYLDEFDFTYEECWPNNENKVLSKNEALTEAANHYIEILNEIGKPKNNYQSEAILPLCTDKCRKVRNGKLLFEGKEFFAAQLDSGKQWLGTWSIHVEELLISENDQAVTIRYKLSTEKEGNLMIIVILYFDSNYLINEINEVHNKLE